MASTPPHLLSRTGGSPHPVRRVVAVSALVLCAVAITSGCGKTITIGDSKSTTAATPAATSAATSAATGASASQNSGGQNSGGQNSGGQNSGNTALQVLDTSAEQNGQTGTGGTVVGPAALLTPPRWVQLSAVTSAPLNEPHLINVNQASLYRFDKDTANPSRSNCNNDCATKWPPVTIQVGGNVYLAGVSPKRVGAIRRQDGDVQLTVGGWPVYRFSGDSRPGDLNGQGVGGTWFAVGPRGQKVTS